MPDPGPFTIYTASERRGEQVTLTLTLELPDGVHIEPHDPADPHLIPTVIETPDLTDSAVHYPATAEKDLGWNGATLTVLEGRLRFVVTGRIANETDVIVGTLSFQPCVGGACLPPRTVEWFAPLAGTTGYSIVGALAA